MKRLLADKKLRNDLILIAALLLIAGVLYLALNLGRQEGGVAVVRVDGVEVERHSLSVNGTFPLNGGSNILVIEDGKVTEEGTHAELVELGGSYARMNRIQGAATGGIA